MLVYTSRKDIKKLKLGHAGFVLHKFFQADISLVRFSSGNLSSKWLHVTNHIFLTGPRRQYTVQPWWIQVCCWNFWFLHLPIFYLVIIVPVPFPYFISSPVSRGYVSAFCFVLLWLTMALEKSFSRRINQMKERNQRIISINQSVIKSTFISFFHFKLTYTG